MLTDSAEARRQSLQPDLEREDEQASPPEQAANGESEVTITCLSPKTK